MVSTEPWTATKEAKDQKREAAATQDHEKTKKEPRQWHEYDGESAKNRLKMDIDICRSLLVLGPGRTSPRSSHGGSWGGWRSRWKNRMRTGLTTRSMKERTKVSMFSTSVAPTIWESLCLQRFPWPSLVGSAYTGDRTPRRPDYWRLRTERFREHAQPLPGGS